MSSDPQPVYYDNHMHTPLCKHAAGEPEEYAETALARGLKGIIITCHSPMPTGWWPAVRMDHAQLDEYLALVARATKALAGRLDVRVGMEMDFFPGMEDWVRKLIDRCDFHHVLGSVHYFSPEYRKKYWKGDTAPFFQQYFTHLAESAETGLFDTLAHPDLVKNLDPDLYEFEDLREHVGACLDRVAVAGTAMELNTSGRLKSSGQFNPGPEMLGMMRERGIPVVLGSDSHTPRRVGSDFNDALDSLEEAGYTEVSHFLNRQRIDLPIPLVRASLRPLTDAH
ncbi:MAG: histidinol phosphatase [Verrucomicrobiales bacterium]|nr:histidinol phosphatase [Verrucomicrobiales bacterium]